MAKKKKAKEPETLVRIADASLALKQTVYRDNRSTMFLWQHGGDFNETALGVSGSFGNILPSGSPYISAKWTGRDGSAQSAIFTFGIQDMLRAVVDAIRNGDAEERAGGSAPNSARPGR